VAWEPECLAAPVVRAQATETQLAPLNSKELWSYRSSSYLGCPQKFQAYSLCPTLFP
jgi:hypothetical protein